ncbi:MAG: PHP domain-containing protein, partial [Chloroflexota bacterium]
GLGPKRVRVLYDQLGITTVEGLKEAAKEQKLRRLDGFGAKLENELLRETRVLSKKENRILLREAEEAAEPLLAYLKKFRGVELAEIAGSYRRGKETVGDLDLVASAQDGKSVIDHFVKYPDIAEILSQGETRSSVVLRSGLQVDLRVVRPRSYGAALFYFTGSRAHNLHLRNTAIDRGLKINEYGVYRGDEWIAGETEAEFYRVFDLPYILPELREERGEIEAALKGKLPEPVSLEQIRGDLHTHTLDSDGKNSLEEMAAAAKALRYEYLAITDHALLAGVIDGLDADGLARQMEAIDRINEKLEGIRLLKGIEVDILEDGSLALPDEVLDRLDICVAAVHSAYELPEKKQTERVIRALDNPNVHILAHPTSRRFGKRGPVAIDLEKVMLAALERGVYLEVNGTPDRLDLDDIHCKLAKEMGLKLVISTDAHSTGELDFIRYGVGQARRGWLEAGDVINTQRWNRLELRNKS